MSNVNHPRHYNASPSGVECIDVVEHMSFNVGNAMKYLWRADEKGAPIEDLQKAAWYINREIEKRKREAVAPRDKPLCANVNHGPHCCLVPSEVDGTSPEPETKA
jgi:hypothetical protein